MVNTDFQKDHLAGDNLNVENERENLTESESNGLVLIDLKRRRVEEPKLYIPNEKQNTKDTYMPDTQNHDQLVSKNEEMAGAALQTRQSS